MSPMSTALAIHTAVLVITAYPQGGPCACCLGPLLILPVTLLTKEDVLAAMTQ